MTLSTFLLVVSAIAFAVSVLAIVFPLRLLESKGATPTAATVVWVRETGVSILASAVMALLYAQQPSSEALRPFFIGSAVLQFGLFPIEVLAAKAGTLARPGGVVPNSILHVVLGVSFSYLALR